MGCRSFGVNSVLVGLHRVGIVKLRDALEKAGASGLTDREAIVDLLIETLAADNYIPDRQVDAFRVSLWREYLRFKGEDFSDFFSEIEVTVTGEAGGARDGFVEMAKAVFADFELKPLVTFALPGDGEASPQLVIDGEAIVSGLQSRQRFKAAVRKSITDW
jgi:hypothetical protein